MAFNPVRKMADNIAAIRIALDFTGQQLSETEVETLKKYAGFGGLKEVLLPPGTQSGMASGIRHQAAFG